MVIGLKYKPYKPAEENLAVGDVRKCTFNGVGVVETFYVVVMAVYPGHIAVRKLHKDNWGATRYLIRDVAPTGLEYAMFVDTKDTEMQEQMVGRKTGRISKTDVRNIRK
ncbi:hypothetical protein AR505_1264 [methanogenic archaeon ISO4-H5]|nr:hypothetical protein AR505_1264 [methanogenic archaeon ISO4-H5]